MFYLANLEEVREEMVAEIKSDIDTRRLYISDRLNDEGKETYPDLLLEAARSGNMESFINSLGLQYFKRYYLRKRPKVVIILKSKCHIMPMLPFVRANLIDFILEQYVSGH